MIKLTLAPIALALLLISCRTVQSTSSSEIPALTEDYAVSVNNIPHHVKGRNYGVPNFLETFEIYDVHTDHIRFSFASKDTLVIRYLDSLTFRTKKLPGKFDKKGFFETFLHKESIEIPPLIPILFSRHNINRMRISLSHDQSLIIDNKWLQGGNILIFGAGDSGRRKSYFKTSSF